MVTTAIRYPASLPVDRDLPGAADLLAGAGVEAVARFLDERGLEPHRVEPAQAHYRPGRSLAVCFRAGAIDRSSGRPECLTVTVEHRAGEAEAIWAFPDDPALPGLPVAADGRLVRRRLRPRPAEVAVEPLRYRPRRRAVLRYRLGDRPTVFAKVVAPRRGRRLTALAQALRAEGCFDGDLADAIAASAAWPSGVLEGRPAVRRKTGAGDRPLRLALPAASIGPGVLILPLVPGHALRLLLLDGGPLPDPERLAALPALLHRQCHDRVPADRRATTRGRVDPATALCAAQVVARLLPGEGGTAGRVAEAVIGWAEASEPPEEWVVHGDLYENQVLVDGDTLGLLDLDDLGWGDPLLDAANFCAHLLVLGASGPPAAGVILRYREELRAGFCRRLDADPAALAWREAYCLLRLASGPFRVLHADWPRRMADRLALAGEALALR